MWYYTFVRSSTTVEATVSEPMAVAKGVEAAPTDWTITGETCK